ncbi:response regulator transcription factor [Alicyclobacillus ferrooxydans]|uniref:Response regulator n=1 Tax=Alicyclobacillus ferrooxydans TaxID=471514 RepID=A0A0P9CDL2_9BACL|nr:response regulator transcription factor [Alicyclobacillus ferrooxydans]KPV43700.1 response regulator [Alicyclobacillus ferrooxydans]
MRILVVEDDSAIRNVIKEAYLEEGYETDVASDGATALWMAEQDIYDLVVLDIMLPGTDGLTILQQLRSKGKRVHVLLVTAKDSITDRVRGLDLGADDYLVKPFALSELLARTRALLRRGNSVDANHALHCGALVLDLEKNQAFAENLPLQLTHKEYEILEFLIRNQGRILTRDQIFQRVWGFDSDAGESVVDVYIHYLRKKLAGTACAQYIETKRGIGFMLKAERK